MYTFSSEENKQLYREKIYSGGAINRTSLYIKNEQIPTSNIKSIKISSPIIDTTQEYFYIGTFVAQKLEIQFKNADEIDLDGEVTLSIGTKIRETTDTDDGYEDVTIGTFLIDTDSETYYKNAQITCYDKSTLFSPNVDISQWFDESKTISAENLLKKLCDKFLGENNLGTYPTINKDVTTGSFDNTLSGKSYISMIAEIMCSNAKIGRDGKLYLVPVKSFPSATINALKGKSWEIKDTYKISGVDYADLSGLVDIKGTRENNVLNIRNSNFFINGTDTNRNAILENIYNELKDFEIHSIKHENYGDPSMDCWDIIEFQLGDETYYSYNDNNFTYEMNMSTTIETTIPSKQAESVTNNVKKGSDGLKINKIENEIDQVNGRVTTTITRVEDVESDLEENYYNKTTTNQMIQDIEKGIINIFSNSSGYNLLVNTAPYNIKSPTELENWEGNISSKTETDSVSKSALLLLKGSVKQIIDVVNGTTYAIGFKYKRLIDGATLKITYNGRVIEIDNENNITYNNETNLKNVNGEITSYNQVLNDNFTIEFECSDDEAFEIYDLRLVYGTVALPWTQNQNEMKSKTVTIGDGISIDSEQANTSNRIDTYGMVVTNKTTNVETLRVTDNGIESDGNLRIGGTSEISGILIKRANRKHIFINGIVED